MGHLHRLIVFDLDGTIIDSRQDLADAANALITELGGRPLPVNDVAGMVGGGAALLVQRALEAARISAPEDAAPRFVGLYDKRLLAHTRAYPGLGEVLATAHARAHVAVLTNKPTAPSEAILRGLGLRRHVDDVLGGDSLMGRKPDPSGLRYLMGRADAIPDGTLLIGDSPIDLDTATRAGTSCCVVSYGFGFAAFGHSLPAGATVVRNASALAAAITAFTTDHP